MADLTYEEKFGYICLAVESGKPLRKVCPQFMSLSKFYDMIREDEVLAKQYAHACEARADKIFDDILAIADDNENDTFIDDNGVTRTNTDVIQRSRLMVDARKWVLAKLAPKKYGEKLDVTSDGEKLQTTIINLGGGLNPNETT